eukprot:TRINITY_DN64692_c0_g1_i1.p6 TRINITY_DN64692_c0_g1~~TRINITY_DN64692_c0_g1_i1.p6  ORF type:complete len:110 (+),score=4.14 TRINITY_DN64692_c0_g1_i1:1176-1505(+)
MEEELLMISNANVAGFGQPLGKYEVLVIAMHKEAGSVAFSVCTCTKKRQQVNIHDMLTALFGSSKNLNLWTSAGLCGRIVKRVNLTMSALTDVKHKIKVAKITSNGPIF